jgi:hypothetical protein
MHSSNRDVLRNPVKQRQYNLTLALAVVVTAFKLLGLGRQGNNFGHKQLSLIMWLLFRSMSLA